MDRMKERRKKMDRSEEKEGIKIRSRNKVIPKCC
jgi:hypothetical protein